MNYEDKCIQVFPNIFLTYYELGNLFTKVALCLNVLKSEFNVAICRYITASTTCTIRLYIRDVWFDILDIKLICS